MAREIITDLDRFIEWTGQFNRGEYLFRGLKGASYIKNGTVETSAHRRLSDEYKSTEQDPLLEINRELIEKARLLGHGQRDGQDLKDLDLLAELQHYGAATCLLDFTFNTLVALWFACQQESGCQKENSAVVVLRSDGPEPLKKVDYELSQKNIDHFFIPDKTGRYPLYQWQPKYQNNRIIAQQSIFVFGHGPIKIENACEIERDSKEEILIALEDLSGITGASLFFDFHGYVWLNAHDKPLIDPTAKEYRRRAIAAKDPEKSIKYFTCAIGINEEKIDEEKIDINEKEALELENAENYRDRGRVHYDRDDFDKAIADYNVSLDLNPEFAAAYNSRGVALEIKSEKAFKDGKVAEANALFDEAIRDYKDAIKNDPNLAKAYSNLGNAYAGQGAFALQNEDRAQADDLFDEAISNYKIAIENDPDLATAYCNLGEAWLHMGEQEEKEDWKNAREALETAREMRVDIAESFGWDYKSVEEFMEKTRISLPDDLIKMLTKKEKTE